MIIENNRRARGIIAFSLSLVIVSAGCSTNRTKPKSPALQLNSPISGKIEATGDAQTPANVATTQTETTVPVPAQSTIRHIEATTTEPARTEIVVSEPTELKTVSNVQTITAPAAFTPPAPPSATEQANADGVRNSYYFAGGLTLLAGLLFWRGHVKAGVIAIVCAVASPLAANFVGSEWGQRIALIGVCIAGSLFAAWHFMRDKNPEVIK